MTANVYATQFRCDFPGCDCTGSVPGDALARADETPMPDGWARLPGTLMDWQRLVIVNDLCSDHARGSVAALCDAIRRAVADTLAVTA